MALQWTAAQFWTVLKVTCPFLILCTGILSKTHLQWVSGQSESIGGLSVFMIYFFHLGCYEISLQTARENNSPLIFLFHFLSSSFCLSEYVLKGLEILYYSWGLIALHSFYAPHSHSNFILFYLGYFFSSIFIYLCRLWVCWCNTQPLQNNLTYCPIRALLCTNFHRNIMLHIILHFWHEN